MIVLWSREQCHAWSIWRNRQIVELVAPQAADDGIITVEQLLAVKKRARWYSTNARNRVIRDAKMDCWPPLQGTPLPNHHDKVIEIYVPGKPIDWVLSDQAKRLAYEQEKEKSWRVVPAAHEIPPIVGSITEFERAVAEGQVAETENHMYRAADVMRVLPELSDPGPGAEGLEGLAKRPASEKGAGEPHAPRLPTITDEQTTKILQKYAPMPEQKAWDAVKNEAPGKHVPRQRIRDATTGLGWEKRRGRRPRHTTPE